MNKYEFFSDCCNFTISHIVKFAVFVHVDLFLAIIVAVMERLVMRPDHINTPPLSILYIYIHCVHLIRCCFFYYFLSAKNLLSQRTVNSDFSPFFSLSLFWFICVNKTRFVNHSFMRNPKGDPRFYLVPHNGELLSCSSPICL